MTLRACCLAVLAMLALCGSAFARCNGVKWRTPESAILVVSFSADDVFPRPPVHIDRTDRGGELEIYSEPSLKEHDFVEQFDASAKLAALNAFGSGHTDFYGVVEVLACPAGSYEFSVGPDGVTAAKDIHFKLESNRVTYIGEFRYTGYKKKNIFGMKQLLLTQWLDNAARDLEIARRAGVDVSNALTVEP